MFRKKQTPSSPVDRTVRRQQTANVFSYHANRSPGSAQQSRRMESESSPKRSSPRRNVRHWIAYAPSLIASLVLALCLGYISTLSTEPKVQVVGMGGHETSLAREVGAYEADVATVFNESIWNRSKLLINTNEIAKEIQGKFPELGDVAVILPLVDRRPVVQIRPAEPVLVLGTVQGAMVVDENGRIMASARDIDSRIKDKLPTIEDQSGLSLDRGGYGFPKETVTFIRTVAAQLSQKGYKLQIMALPPIANELHVRLEGMPYYVKFNVRGEGRLQVGTLIALRQKLEAGKHTPREYIDVRVPGKAYYK
jgi:hypothetical protein